MTRKKFKSTLKSSSTKLPKSRITKDPEEKPRKIREKKQYDRQLHKKRLPAKPVDIAPPLDPEQQRIKRKQAAKKAVETRKKNEAAMPPEVLKQKRAEAARKAKETRRNKESALPQKEREELRQKRAEQARKNFTKKKEETSQEWFDSELDYASYTDEVLRQLEEFLYDFSFEEKYLGYYSSNRWENLHQSRANFQGEVLHIYEARIAAEGKESVARSIADSGVDISTAIDGIKYASDQEQVNYYGRELLQAIIGRPMTLAEANIYNDIAEGYSSYDMGDDEGEY